MTSEYDQSTMMMMMNARETSMIDRDVTRINQNTNTIQTHISSKANVIHSCSEATIRPPTRTRVTKLARRRNKIIHIGTNTRDIRNFFTPKQGTRDEQG